MNKTFLLREYYELCEGGICKDFLTEEEKKDISENGAVYLTGIFQRANAKNYNGRIYRRPLLEREEKLYQKLINESRALGSLDHEDSSIVTLENASHLIKSLWWKDEELWGKLKVLREGKGKILRGHLADGVTIGISSRGLGSVRETNEGLLVEDDFQLICFDVVSDPSTLNAFMRPMMMENKQVSTKADRLNRILAGIVE